uniref:Peptidase M10 metallopeptidase domain-containing protein n=1 Tax=Glycine max TaxID=3847 RepID=K7K645_SOYBN
MEMEFCSPSLIIMTHICLLCFQRCLIQSYPTQHEKGFQRFLQEVGAGHHRGFEAHGDNLRQCRHQGDIRLKGAILWSLPSEKESLSWENGVLDLESAAMHLLGLDHSNKEDSVMYPNVLPWQQRKGFLEHLSPLDHGALDALDFLEV